MFTLTVALTMMIQGPVIDGQRQTFMKCLATNSKAAETQKVTAEGFAAFIHQACGPNATTLKESLVKFDTTHGVTRKQAETDDQGMIDDFFKEAADHYRFRSGESGKPAAAAPATPATPATHEAAAPTAKPPVQPALSPK